jgi:hypothetical protein
MWYEDIAQTYLQITNMAMMQIFEVRCDNVHVAETYSNGNYAHKITKL